MCVPFEQAHALPLLLEPLLVLLPCLRGRGQLPVDIGQCGLVAATQVHHLAPQAVVLLAQVPVRLHLALHTQNRRTSSNTPILAFLFIKVQIRYEPACMCEESVLGVRC